MYTSWLFAWADRRGGGAYLSTAVTGTAGPAADHVGTRVPMTAWNVHSRRGVVARRSAAPAPVPPPDDRAQGGRVEPSYCTRTRARN